MVQRLVIWLLMVALVGSVGAEDAKKVVVSSAEGLKGIKAKKITWKKDGAKMVRIPYTYPDDEKKYDARLRHSFPIPTKSLKLVSGTIGYGVIRRLSAALSWHPFFLLLTHPI